MSTDRVVQVHITRETQQVSQAGFGTPLILSAHDLFDDLVREYTDLAGMVTDGFTSSTPEYKAANAIFAQSPRPPKLKIGRRATSAPLLSFTLVPVVKNDTEYLVVVNGRKYTVTSDSSALASDIVAGLVSAINGDAATDGIVTASGSDKLVLTADARGGWFDVDADLSLFSVVCDHADEGPSPGGSETGASVADDLAAIMLVDDDWYGLVSVFKSEDEIVSIASWAEANGKLFVVASSNTDILGSGDTDVASGLKASAYDRTTLWYHRYPGEFLDAALLGNRLPRTPGSDTWKFKTLAGVTADKLTPTHRSNALGKNAGIYTTIGGVNKTEEGVVASGEFIDNIRFLDWVAARQAEGVFGLLARSEKVPYTDAGGQAMGSIVRGVLDEGVANGGFSDDPGLEPTVTVPRASEQSQTDRLARHFPGIKWVAYLAGAVHSARVEGTVTV